MNQSRFPLTDPELEQKIEQLKKEHENEKEKLQRSLKLYEWAEEARGQFENMLACWQWGHTFGDRYCDRCGCHWQTKDAMSDKILQLMRLLDINDRGKL